jgi:hypothetical protein
VGVDFFDAEIGPRVFVDRMPPAVTVSMVDLFIVEKNVMPPIELVSQSSRFGLPDAFYFLAPSGF